ncbi:MAG: hypothetical protein AAB840_02825 [Patescibacteria group bacterium]
MSFEENPIKESFQKVKEDMQAIKQAINQLSEELEAQRNNIEEIKRTLIQTQEPNRQTNQQRTPTDNYPLQALKPQNLPSSIGNDGVPTDRQTNQQTDRHMEKFALNMPISPKIPPIHPRPIINSSQEDNISKIAQVSDILDSLDGIKKELRSQIKKLTQQEMLVFSTLYQLTQEGTIVDYSLLASKTKLSESSIRDYILKIIKKGIPVDKTKENNKRVVLTIPENFKKIASLNTILALREL